MCFLALSFNLEQSQATCDSFLMMRVSVSDSETRTRLTHFRETADEFEFLLIFEFDEILSLIPVFGCLHQYWPSSTERGWERVKKEFLVERIKAWAVGSLRGSFEVEPTIRLGPGGWVRLLRLPTAQCSSGSRKHTDSPPFPTIQELSQLQKEFLIWIVQQTFE